jgi:CHAT domain-containing protein
MEQTTLQERILDLERDLINLRQQMRIANPQYAALQFPKPISLSDVQRTLLQDGEMLLEYFWGRDALHLFVVGQGTFHTLNLLVDEQAVTKRLAQFLAPLHSQQTGDRHNFIETLRQFDLHLAHDLYEQLVQPAAPYLANAKTLLIVPDGILHYLPFELLVTAPYKVPANPDVMFAEYQDAPYLVRRYAIAYAPSATVLQPDLLYQAQQSAKPSRTLLALAPFSGEPTASHASQSPSFLQKLLQTFWGLTREAEETVRTIAATPLPHSRREVEAISKVFHPNATALLAQQATLEAVQTQAKDYRYVHLATHGFVNEDLRADLVTLSACETGLGALEQGEGLVGLTRAFMYAGTPSVLASLWAVNDAATAEVMTTFYQGLYAGAGKARALRQAKEKMMQQQVGGQLQGKRVTISLAHPYFWAPFILAGGWR